MVFFWHVLTIRNLQQGQRWALDALDKWRGGSISPFCALSHFTHACRAETLSVLRINIFSCAQLRITP